MQGTEPKDNAGHLLLRVKDSDVVEVGEIKIKIKKDGIKTSLLFIADKSVNIKLVKAKAPNRKE